MANEATLVIETMLPIPFVVADGTGIEKGTLLKLTDGMVAIATSGGGDMLAGIAAEEKIANDGKTTLGVYTQGIFKMTADAAIVIGAAVMADGTANKIITSSAKTGAAQLGYALETAAGVGNTLFVNVNIGASGAIA